VPLDFVTERAQRVSMRDGSSMAAIEQRMRRRIRGR
jgi:hypothetical protein